METDVHKRNTRFVLFGASGDLARRLIVPALFNLFLDRHLPERFVLLGVDRGDSDDGALAEAYRQGVAAYSRRGNPPEESWRAFAAGIRYFQADATDAAGYAKLREVLEEQGRQWDGAAETVFYMATPPALFGPISRGLAAADLSRDRDRSRIVVEKPLGHDLDSFCEINHALSDGFDERQIFRIDHYLGKETVQNILALRFANSIFEPIWDRRYIDHVAITVAETLGVEHRGGYYEHAGALRDMVQNHLLQLLCLVAMEPPVAYDADDIRGKKMDVLRALRPIPQDAVSTFAVRGQYGRGWIGGQEVPAYREEPGVDPESNTETFAALKLYVDNWRWQDVPFYLRTGKRMTAQVSEISIRFRDVPHRAFPASAGLNAQPARLVIQIQPEEGVVLKFMAKEPGSLLRLRPVDMRFSYRESFRTESPHAYETLLRDVMISDATLFMRADQVQAAWRLLMPVLAAWRENPTADFPNYASGSWGPAAAEALVARDGISWLTPTLGGRRSEA
ncbi:MAG: glucose-6-phosphate dehydrogenase [Chromatiales bacterium 21-64-14]|nr:MAG: glucose-6-phosphate dehydrogenase [Chromatiales bacterium 21-64-14]HQU15709.1 glucose-6-phosphate dehydrogenase [Gammaproteobacteria bacterium]